MKKLIFAATAAFTLMFGLVGFAQAPANAPRQQRTPEQMAERQTQMMTENLKLTEAQAKQVYSLNLESAKARKAKSEVSDVDRKAHAEKLNAILTPEQQQTLKEWREKRKDGMKRGGKRSLRHQDSKADKSCAKECTHDSNHKAKKSK